MALKSSNKIDTNTYEIEVTVDGETFKKSLHFSLSQRQKKIFRFPASARVRQPRA
ncbi:MAG: hypothetical protein L6V88_04220 [Anaerotruncus sp.]|nr:MAG: hypothetical protein L6V88_04220 [Anaerotruncus sp.]